MRVIYFNHPDKAVTGGHKYNDQFLEIMKNETHCNLILLPQMRTLYSGIRQMLSPILELKRLRTFKTGDVVFWGDTTFKYHFLLLFLTKLFCHTTNIVIIHHFPFLELHGFKRLVYEALQRFYYSQADYIIVPSPYTKDIAERLFGRERIVYIPLPFSTKYAVSDNYRPGNLLYIGTIEPRKGLHLLLQALALLRKERLHFTLSIVGKVINSEYKNHLDDIIKENDLQECVTYLGRISNEALEKNLCEAEVFSFPSLLEGYGIVLVEAMSHGLPIVAFDNSAMPYSIKSGYNGLLARNKDINDYATQLKSILSNTALRKKLQIGMEHTVKNLKQQCDFNTGVINFCKNHLER